MKTERVGPLEVFGLTPLVPALRECWLAIAGDAHTPPSQFGLSSLRIFKPRLSFPLWLGLAPQDGRVALYNLPNRAPAPKHEGYSVKVTYCRDFRGGQLSYDGHVGTDFAIPVGTVVTATAPGVVRQVRKDMQRGGLKVVIDHGHGLVTTSNHLARSLVRVGQQVARGEPIALSGMSSVDGILFFPWLAPHLHLNVCLDGDPVDPFAKPGETPLWRGGNAPVPYEGPEDRDFEPTEWDAAGLQATIDACRDPSIRQELEAVTDLEERGVAVTMARLFHAATLDAFPPVVTTPSPRTPHLTLPFRPEDVRGVYYPDGLAPPAV